jgi:hypothetical protein
MFRNKGNQIKNKWGQSAIEFIIVLGVVLFFFVLFFGAIQISQRDKEKENQDRLFQNIALDVRDEINIASGASDGYYREFTIPQNVLGTEYEINLTDIGYVYLKSDRYATSYKATKINGNIQKGVNIIKKENGQVYLN